MTVSFFIITVFVFQKKEVIFTFYVAACVNLIQSNLSMADTYGS